ncbi:hypothetical protein CRG98_034961 [Punica granatum]|uniref:RNase H type-1 domain-containing protein n=1 Tax=Punica granatum TaxID=22663 RepID=A0A2I0IMK4_PUNGR|nr:hypothetical protein CRG98_034961 [Punica granatum]
MGGFAQNIGFANAVAAELWAVKSGLDMVWDLGVRRLVLEVDSEVVLTMLRVLQSNRDFAVWHEAILKDIRSLIQRDWTVVIQHVYGKGNMCDDCLANHALSLPFGIHRLGSCPKD